MPSPFPGMDPYLEQPAFWPEFQNHLAYAIQRALNAVLPESYVARAKPRTELGGTVYDDIALQHWVSSMPQAAPPLIPAPLELLAPLVDKQRVTSIAAVQITTKRIVTILEIRSPVNKAPDGLAYRQYRSRQVEMLQRRANWVEIDLLRQGQRMPMSQPLPDAPYFIILGRGSRYPICEIWPLQLQDVLPVIPVPLLPGDPDIPLDLGAVFTQVYDSARFDKNVNYSAEPPGPLSDARRAWITERLTAAGVRP